MITCFPVNVEIYLQYYDFTDSIKPESHALNIFMKKALQNQHNVMKYVGVVYYIRKPGCWCTIINKYICFRPFQTQPSDTYGAQRKRDFDALSAKMLSGGENASSGMQSASEDQPDQRQTLQNPALQSVRLLASLRAPTLLLRRTPSSDNFLDQETVPLGQKVRQQLLQTGAVTLIHHFTWINEWFTCDKVVFSSTYHILVNCLPTNWVCLCFLSNDYW